MLVLGQLSHPNLVKLVGYCCEDQQRVLIYEYMALSSVEKKLFTSNFFIQMFVCCSSNNG